MRIKKYTIEQILLLWIYSLRIVFITNKLQRIILFTFLFVVNIIVDSITLKKQSFVLIVYTTFVFLCISNVLGMVPYSLTITSHLIITLYFSLAFFIGNNIIFMSQWFWNQRKYAEVNFLIY